MKMKFEMEFRIYDNSGPIALCWGRAENSLTRSDGEILFLAFFGDFYHWGIAENTKSCLEVCTYRVNHRNCYQGWSPFLTIR